MVKCVKSCNLPENHIVEMIRLNQDAFPCVCLVVSPFVHHDLELHFRFTNHAVHNVRIHRAQLAMFLEKVDGRVILLRRATQAMCLSFSGQIAKLWLLRHSQMSGTLNRWHTFSNLRTWLAFLERRDCVKGKENKRRQIRQ